MKKILIILFVMLSCIGCKNQDSGNESTCSVCDEIKKGDTYTITNNETEKSYTEFICNDCIRDFKLLIESIGDSVVSNSGADLGDLSETTDDEEYIDAEEYYNSHSKVVETIKVEESSSIKTVAEAMNLLSTKGFDSSQARAKYSIEGEFIDTSITQGSNKKYPIYEVQYISKSNEMWTITVVDEFVMAFPVSFNLQSKLDAELIVSEHEFIMSYDEYSNKFFKNIPYETTAHIKVVDRIDATALDTLTIEVLNKE